MKKNNENNENKVKLSEKFSLALTRKWLVNGTKTFLIIAILIAAYICLNMWLQTQELPKLDVTENKIYTLTDASKKAIEKINQDVTIYVYGYNEKSTLFDLLKQYNKANEKIKYELLNEENNYEMVKEHDLKEDYVVLIIKSGESEKVINAATDFYSYDYTTYQRIDTTEQTLTNSILSLTEENKPKVYFVEGHQEFGSNDTPTLRAYLTNEAFIVDNLNIATRNEIPADCDILAIMSPNTDILDSEAQLIKNYINNGGNVYFSMDVISQTIALPNIQSILDEYGVSVQNGYIVEFGENKSNGNFPHIFMPEVSSTNKITADIYTDSYMWLVYSARLQFKDEETLKNLNVTKETLLSSTEKSGFITDIEADMNTAVSNVKEFGSSEIASLVTKKIVTTNENGEEQTKESKLVIAASGNFVSDYQISALSSNYPLSYLGSNKDFVINAMSYLGDKENTITIRKDMANSTYTPTDVENRVVLTIIFAIPLIIILIGIIVWSYRQKRK